MVLEAVVAGMGGANMLWKYNRSNFMYDREMRLKQEFKVMKWRCEAAELWRDDIREIIGLTERRMDSYLIVSALQLDMCIGLFCEGRMEPGTPPYLINLYMLTLGGAFMYLLMAIWLAMHAAVVAQCSSVRLLTQFVRLPVPSWPHLEAARTYACNFESIGKRNMLRVPFVSENAKPSDLADGQGLDKGSSQSVQGSGENHIDPWRTERARTDIYELMRTPVEFSHHVNLAKKAARHYQCYDAFARVAMTFGTNQLLSAIAYFSMGYCSVQDRALSASWCVVLVMVSIACVLVELDISLSRIDRLIAQVLIGAGPFCATVSTYTWVRYGVESDRFIRLAYASHTLWLLFARRKLRVEKQGNGSLLPLRFRPTLYLDIFGWLNRKGNKDRADESSAEQVGYRVGSRSDRKDGYTVVAADENDAAIERSHLAMSVGRDVNLLESDMVQQHMDLRDRDRVAELAKRFRTARGQAAAKATEALLEGSHLDTRRKNIVRMKGYSDTGAEIPFAVDAETGSVVYDDTVGIGTETAQRGMVRTITQVERNVERLERLDEELGDTGDNNENDIEKPTSKSGGRKKAIARWMAEEAEPLGWHASQRQLETNTSGATGSKDELNVYDGVEEEDEEDGAEDMYDIFATFPHAADGEVVMASTAHAHPGKTPWKMFSSATSLLVLLWAISGCLPLRLHLSEFGDIEGEEVVALSSAASRAASAEELTGGVPMDISWPSHAGFIPRGFSCDRAGQRLIVADDFHIYATVLPKPSFVASVENGVGAHNIVAQTESRRASAGVGLDGFSVSATQAAEAFDPAMSLPQSGSLRGAPKAAIAQTYVTQFEQMPHCDALEGQVIKDVDLVCRSDGTTCRSLVLHGKNLTECPFHQSGGSASSYTDASYSLNSEDETGTFTIMDDWLDSDVEDVQAVAANIDCINFGDGRGADMTFQRATTSASCVAISTSLGRMVELRPQLLNERSLVPDRSIQERSDGEAIHQGGLHILDGRFVLALRQKLGTMQALRIEDGHLAGEWRLPAGLRWLALCGGGGNLYFLGRETALGLRLWRFPVPDVLK